jgi:hypothetical protein
MIVPKLVYTRKNWIERNKSISKIQTAGRPMEVLVILFGSIGVRVKYTYKDKSKW